MPALIDASLDLFPGEIHALMGENGAGKSTLIKLLAGVVSADSMAVTLRGTPISIHSPQAALAHGLRFIYQELNCVLPISVAENIYMGYRIPTRAGVFVDWRRLRAEAQKALAQLNITHIDPAAIMARLSAGDQMLVKIAASLVSARTPASIYIMDEPTAALSTHEIDQLFSVIRRLAEQGAAILYVSHRLDEIFRIADRVTVMRDGRVVSTRPVQETSAPALIEAMTGRALKQVFPPRGAGAQKAIRFQVEGVRTHAVRDLTFSLAAGEVLGVAGLAGSGRTALLRALMGLDPLLAGSIILDGTVFQRITPRRAWRRGIAYIPEERRSQALILSRSISDNIVLPYLRDFSRWHFVLDRPRERRASAALGDKVRLKARGTAQTIRELSGGNQQKAIFARVMAHQPRLLLLDEPTRGVDVGAKFDIYTLIRQVSAEGVPLIVVSSELPELIGLCDRILIMRRGRQVAIASAEGLTESSLLALCYGEIAHAQ
jgi:ribose transport system ATP-binding protein